MCLAYRPSVSLGIRRPTASHSVARDAVSVRLLGSTAATGAIVSAIAGRGLLSACFLVLAGAVSLPGKRAVVDALPSAVVCLLFINLLTAQLAAIPRYGLLSTQGRCQLLLILAAVCLLFLSLRSNHRKKILAVVDVPGILPSTLLILACLGMSWMSVSIKSGWYLTGGSDNLTHLIEGMRRGADGFLSYATDPYPGAWSTAVALINGASVQSSRMSPVVLEQWIGNVTEEVLLLYAVFALAVGLLARALAATMHLSPRVSGILAFGSSATMLGAPFLGFVLPYGFQSHLLVALVIVVAIRECIDAAEGAVGTAVLVTVCGALAAHAWTLGVVFVAVPWAWAVLQLPRSPTNFRAWGTLAATVALAAVSVLPLVLAINHSVGIGHAGAQGAVASLPGVWVIGGLIAAGIVARKSALGFLPLGTSAFGSLCAVVIALHSRVPLDSYYPSKMLWLGAVLGVPAVWVAGALIIKSVDRRMTARPAVLVRALGSAWIALFLLVSVLTPLMLLWQGAKNTQAADILRAVEVPGAARAQIAWNATSSSTFDVFVRILLDSYEPSRPGTPVAELSVDQECVILRSSDHPAVITSRSSAEVKSRYSCVGDLATITVRSSR